MSNNVPANQLADGIAAFNANFAKQAPSGDDLGRGEPAALIRRREGGARVSLENPSDARYARERTAPMKSDGERTVRILSLFLGISILTFGVLKFVDPFHTWFAIQIKKSGLPAPAFGLGIAGEISIGLALIAPWVVRKPLEPYRRRILVLASLGLIVNMLVATYVHLHPDVPADVLPLKIKPPILPLSILGLAVLNVMRLSRRAMASLAS